MTNDNNGKFLVKNKFYFKNNRINIKTNLNWVNLCLIKLKNQDFGRIASESASHHLINLSLSTLPFASDNWFSATPLMTSMNLKWNDKSSEFTYKCKKNLSAS